MLSETSGMSAIFQGHPPNSIIHHNLFLIVINRAWVCEHSYRGLRVANSNLDSLRPGASLGTGAFYDLHGMYDTRFRLYILTYSTDYCNSHWAGPIQEFPQVKVMTVYKLSRRMLTSTHGRWRLGQVARRLPAMRLEVVPSSCCCRADDIEGPFAARCSATDGARQVLEAAGA